MGPGVGPGKRLVIQRSGAAGGSWRRKAPWRWRLIGDALSPSGGFLGPDSDLCHHRVGTWAWRGNQVPLGVRTGTAPTTRRLAAQFSGPWTLGLPSSDNGRFLWNGPFQAAVTVCSAAFSPPCRRQACRPCVATKLAPFPGAGSKRYAEPSRPRGSGLEKASTGCSLH